MRRLIALITFFITTTALSKQIEPGDVLDQAVAKEVMGWGDPRPVHSMFDGKTPSPEGYEYDIYEGEKLAKIVFPHYFSTSDVAADELLAKIQKMGGSPTVTIKPDLTWECHISGGTVGVVVATGTSKAHATSIGSLKFIGKSVENLSRVMTK